MSPTDVIHSLIDIVSKNGNLLLNVGLSPDGALEDQQRQALRNCRRMAARNSAPGYLERDLGFVSAKVPQTS